MTHDDVSIKALGTEECEKMNYPICQSLQKGLSCSVVLFTVSQGHSVIVV